MAKIVDPDQLNQGTEIDFNASLETYTLNIAGNLSNDGVSGQALFSFFKEEWVTDTTLIKYPFPAQAFRGGEELQFGNNGFRNSNWGPAADATRNLQRDCGWTEFDDTGAILREYAGIISLNGPGAADQGYYENVADTPVDFTFLGPVNEGVQIFGDINNGNFTRKTLFNIFTREFQKKFFASNLAAIDVTTMQPIVYRFALGDESDALKITTADATVSTTSPWTEILLRYFPSAYNREVDIPGTPRDFGVVIDIGTHSGVDGSVTLSGNTLTTTEGGIVDDGRYEAGELVIHEGTNKGTYAIATGAGAVTATTVQITTTFPATDSALSFTIQRATPVVATAEQTYEAEQYLLRQNADVDATTGSVIGKVATQLVEFIGDDLKAGVRIPTNPNGGGSGVMIEGFDANDTNRLFFTDNTGTERQFQFVSAGTINNNANLQNDSAAVYRMLFKETKKTTATDVSVSGAAGASATLNSVTVDFTGILTGEQFRVEGFVTDAENNGLWQATGNGLANSIAADKVDGINPADTAAGDSVTVRENPYRSANAITVQDSLGSDIAGLISAAAAIPFDFAYDGNTQGGRSAVTPADVIIVAQGLDTAEWAEAELTITRNVGLAASLVSPLSRTYLNAA